ncbi:Sir2 family NAD-dependent protein deacetylase (plasmid) [Pseudomonas silesiensis]|uniref:Sir2 family NAD-dependent protein deacetylase n=1 Tax=Pseudomonas silesiensis TaxID=1853130 RepID=UPI0030D0B33F
MKIMMVTGAGINESCGLSTYDPALGRYTSTEIRPGVRIEQVMTPELLVKDPGVFWSYWRDYCKTLDVAVPGAAHDAIRDIAELATEFVEVTQNHDEIAFNAKPGVHWRITLHGRADDYYCADCKSTFSEFYLTGMKLPPSFEGQGIFRCSTGHADIRPDVAWMREGISIYEYDRALAQAGVSDVLVICGASISYSYILNFVEATLSAGGQVLYIDPQASSFNSRFMKSDLDLESITKIQCIQGSPDKVLPALAAFIRAKEQGGG